MVLQHRLATPVHPVLNPQESITTRLEDTAELERPRDLGGRGEEPKHLHAVAHQPTP